MAGAVGEPGHSSFGREFGECYPGPEIWNLAQGQRKISVAQVGPERDSPAGRHEVAERTA